MFNQFSKSIGSPNGRMILILSLLLTSGHGLAQETSATIPLQGTWRFSMDRADTGETNGWFRRDLTGTIQLPGVLQAQGYGDEISIETPWVLSLYDREWFLRQDYQAYTNSGKVKVPFVCQPPRHYLGVAWYQRDILIPPDWQGRRVVLFLERPHWETTVWLDNHKIGSNNSLCAPHEYDLGSVSPGKHRLSIRVNNQMILPYRPDAHSVSDSLGSSWNGIVGAIQLRATPRVWIDETRVFPNVADKSVRIVIQIGNDTGKPGAGTLRVGQVSQPVQWSPTGGSAEIEVPLGQDAQLWDEFHPVLQRLKVRLDGLGAGQEVEVSFGLREFKAEGHTFSINGRPTYLRGTHHGGDFPLTGYPPTDLGYWLKLFRVCKTWGLNHMRFHSFCPPEAAFEAADRVGVYLQPECGMWNTFNLGSAMEAMLYAETERIIKAYGNHPSFVMLSPSNEPKGRWRNVLPQWAAHFRALDNRRLYTSGTGFTDADAPGPLDQVDYTATSRFGRNRVRGPGGWFGRDYSRAVRDVKIPVVAHEVGQWCAYPDYRVISKFTGYARPGNFEIFRDSLAAHGLMDREASFAWASGRFQLECYKEEIEANLRTPGLSGFQLLDLHDYTGQGTALVGLLDPFWEEKGYVTAPEFREFCNTTVPLARLRQRVFTAEEKFEVPVEIAHYGEQPIEAAQVRWSVLDSSGTAAEQGNWAEKTIPIGKNTELGTVSADLSKLKTPGAFKLVVTIDGTPFHNEWNFWVYPGELSTNIPPGVLVTSSWGDAAARLSASGKVLFLPAKADLPWNSPPLDSVPVFWNRYMNPGWSRMLGIWCDTNHPALAEFPTDANCDWQWTEMLRGTRAVNLDSLPGQLQPVVQAIDDWNRNWKLGLAFECRVGSGRLMICSIDLNRDLTDRPVARQLRRSMLDYMTSDHFQPKVSLTTEQLERLWFDTRVMHELGAMVQADGQVADAIVDGDPDTFWSSVGRRGREDGRRYPHEITVTFTNEVPLQGIVLMDRQNDRNHQGDIHEFKIESSNNGQEWNQVITGELASTWNPQRVEFPAIIKAKRLRLTALSGYGNDASASLAELAVLYTGPHMSGENQRAVEYRRVRSTSTDVDEAIGDPTENQGATTPSGSPSRDSE